MQYTHRTNPNPDKPSGSVPFNARSMYALPPFGAERVSTSYGAGTGTGGPRGQVPTAGTQTSLGLNVNTNSGLSHFATTPNPQMGAGDLSGVAPMGPHNALAAVPATSTSTRAKCVCVHPNCSKEFAWPQDLAKHVRRHHCDAQPGFLCEWNGCGKRFYERKLLAAHTRTHTDERPFVCSHAGCGSKFRARNALAYHLKALHETATPFVCDEPGCGFSTKRADSLATHQRRHKTRDAEKEWRDAKNETVKTAVAEAKHELKETTATVQMLEKRLASETKELAKETKGLMKLKEKLEALQKKLGANSGMKANGSSSSGKRKNAPDGTGNQNDSKRLKTSKEAHVKRVCGETGDGNESRENDDDDDDGQSVEVSENDSDGDDNVMCGIVLPDDDDAPIMRPRGVAAT